MKRLLLAAGLALFSGAAHAACVLPYTITPETLADATAVMANFNAVNGCVNTTMQTGPAGIRLIADNTGATDVSAALLGGINAAIGAKTPLYIPGGTYKVSSRITYTFPDATSQLTIIGDGQERTFLNWPSGAGGIQITFNAPTNSVALQGMTLTTGTTNGGDAIQLLQTATNLPAPGQSPQSTISKITVRGADGFAKTDYWTNCFHITGVSVINGDSLNCDGSGAGTGVTVDGGSASLFPVIYNFSKLNFNALTFGMSLGNYVQGVTVTQSNFISVGVGIDWNSPTFTDQLNVSDSSFNFTSIGIRSQAADVFIHHNLFYENANAAIGVELVASRRFTVDHNAFVNTGTFTTTAGDRVDQETNGGIITNNTYDKIFYPHVYFVVANYADFVSGNQNVNSSGSSLLTASVTAFLDTPYAGVFLPACAAVYTGRHQMVNDSTTNTWGNTYAGIGADVVDLVCDGTNWTVSGK